MPSMTWWRLALNFLLFQIGWFACLLVGMPWLLGICSVLLMAHFIWVVPKQSVWLEVSLLFKVLVVGFCLELLYLYVDVLVRSDGVLIPPVWLLLIWVLFATTFSYSLRWLRKKLYLSAIFAAIAAPLSYYAGVNLNSLMSFNSDIFFSVALIAVSWAITFPFLLWWLFPHSVQGSALPSEHKQ